MSGREAFRVHVLGRFRQAGAHQGGIEHFFEQFAGPMTAWWKVLGQPVLTPEVQKQLIDSATLKFTGALSKEQRQDLLRVAKKCPIHKLMTEVTTEISTVLSETAEPVPTASSL
jgi:hypothetical protein